MKTVNDGPVATLYGKTVFVDERVPEHKILITSEGVTMADEKEMSWEEKFTTKRLEELIEDVGNAEPGSIPGVLTDIYDTTQPRWHTVHIDIAINGFIVKIGCKTFVETYWNTDRDHEGLAQKLFQYWEDPIAAEKKYCK